MILRNPKDQYGINNANNNTTNQMYRDNNQAYERTQSKSSPAAMSNNYETIYRKRFGSRALLSRLGTVLLHFSRRSTIHGLNHLAQARSAKHRLFWLTISCCASLGFCINLFYLIEKFLQTPVLTNVFHDYNNFTYPDISVCIINPIFFPPPKTNQYKDLFNIIKEFDELNNQSRLKYSSVIRNFSYTQKIELSDYLFMHRNLEYSHQSWSAIILCRYLQSPCNYSHFEIRHLWPYGNCFTFNGTKMGEKGSRNVKRNSLLNGWRPDFKIVIYKALEYPKALQLDPFNDINKPSGVLVMIHEANTYPHIGESFVVDSFTQVDLKITTKSHLSTVKKCKSKRNNYTYYDFKTNTSTRFVGRQGDCLFSIIQTNIAKYCGCQFHKMPILDVHKNLPFCFDSSFMDKHKNLSDCLKRSLNDVDKNKIRHMCYRDLCEHPSFTTVVSHSKYPAVGERQTHLLWLKKLVKLEELEFSNYKRSNIFQLAIYPSNKTNPHNFTSIQQVYRSARTDLLNEKFINKNFMHLRFVPSSLFMDHVEETEEYPLSRLLSDIGGCVGLWVGASLITVFEFIDLLLDLTEILRYRAQAAAAFRRQALRSQNTSGNKHILINCPSNNTQYTCIANESPPSTSTKIPNAINTTTTIINNNSNSNSNYYFNPTTTTNSTNNQNHPQSLSTNTNNSYNSDENFTNNRHTYSTSSLTSSNNELSRKHRNNNNNNNNNNNVNNNNYDNDDNNDNHNDNNDNDSNSNDDYEQIFAQTDIVMSV